MYRIEVYNDEYRSVWDDFVFKKCTGNFLHSRCFLDYHKNRFIERSLLVFDDNKLIALFSASSTKEEPLIVTSHIGSTYGGLLYDASVYGNEIVDIYRSILVFYRALDVQSVVVKLTPSIYKPVSFEDEEYAIWINGGVLKRIDLSCYIDLENRLKVSSLRKRMLKLAKKSNLLICDDFNKITSFYDVLAETLLLRHDARPVHTLPELVELHKRLDKNINLYTVKNSSGVVIAGVLFFLFDKTIHCQYIASVQAGQDVGALDLLFEQAINDYGIRGYRYFSFGTSNEDNGQTLNSGLYRFKRQFGSQSICHKFYNFSL
jgi:hypothetical protein